MRWYCRYGASYRDLEQMMGEREVSVDHSTIKITNDIGGEARIFERAYGLGLSALAEAIQIFNKRLELKTV